MSDWFKRFCLQYPLQLYTTLSSTPFLSSYTDTLMHDSIIVYLAHRVMVVRNILAVVARVLQRLIMFWNQRSSSHL